MKPSGDFRVASFPIEQTPAVAQFRVSGAECVIVQYSHGKKDPGEVVGAFNIDGRKFAVVRRGAVPPFHDPLAILSPRELEIARCIAAGYQTKAIARRLRISYHTVRVHVGRIYCKLGLHKQTELASWISRSHGELRPGR